MSTRLASDWLQIRRGQAPLLVSLPHTGTLIPAAIEAGLCSPWLGRRDADWWVELLYDFAGDLDVTTVRTAISRTVIDVNRNPDGISLYPGQATTALCPTTTFDGDPLYVEGRAPLAAEIEQRKAQYYAPYHEAIGDELARLRKVHAQVVIYDAHSIRSIVPRLFDGVLPHLNLGTNGGTSCSPLLLTAVERSLQHPEFARVTDGRFRGGYITRHYGRPALGVHALQMELAIRGYLQEPTSSLSSHNWPPSYDPDRAAPLRAVLRRALEACLNFALTDHG